MRLQAHIAAALVLAWLVASCTGAPAETALGRVEILVAPFDLTEVTDATYTLRLRNGDGDVVWVKEDISSSRYGDGDGSLTYVGTCDPTSLPNSIELVLVDLYDGTLVIPASEYQNPCTPTEPCVLPVTCSESGETQPAIEFNLTIAMSSLENKGFFDIGIRFSDIFCSSQLSCRDELLFVASERSKTHTLGFTCVAGVATTTHLYIDDLVVTCDNGSASLNPSLETGNQVELGPVGAWSIFRNNVELAGMRQGYWNIAFALVSSANNCHVSSMMTASEEALVDQVTPAHTTYPFIILDYPLGDAADACHPLQQLDSVGSGLWTEYTDINEALCYEHEAEVKSTGLSVDDRDCP
jgi:hypothetical protein